MTGLLLYCPELMLIGIVIFSGSNRIYRTEKDVLLRLHKVNPVVAVI